MTEPWVLEWYETGGYDCITGAFVVSCGDRTIAKIDGADFGQDRCEFDWTPTDEMKEYAHLIAAAPDMLEALEELQKRITDQGFPYDGQMLTVCRAAIAKAKGESS